MSRQYPTPGVVYRTLLFLCFMDVVWAGLLSVPGGLLWWRIMVTFWADIQWLYHSRVWYYQFFGYYGIWVGFLAATFFYFVMLYNAWLALTWCWDSLKSLVERYKEEH